MAAGGGRYGDVAERIRKELGAEGVVLVVMGGSKGSGFSCQGNLRFQLSLPETLETVARQVRADMKSPDEHCPACLAGDEPVEHRGRRRHRTPAGTYMPCLRQDGDAPAPQHD